MIEARKKPPRKADPLADALRRLIAATDRSIHATDEVRRARVALARLTDGDEREEGRRDA